MTDIDLTEAIEAVADVVRRNVYVRRYETVVDAAVVPQILAAALPHIERQIREQVAREIEDYREPYPWDMGIRSRHPYTDRWTSSEDAVLAARIARGES